MISFGTARADSAAARRRQLIDITAAPMNPNDSKASIFVSHSSRDLTNVRQVRNYLEERGGAPLLFHLTSLRHPEQFWPIIHREIQSRNFFLFCDSQAARQSEWVLRERDAVRSISISRPIRAAIIDVENEIDYSVLDRLLTHMRCYLITSFRSSEVAYFKRYAEALDDAGFHLVLQPPTPRFDPQQAVNAIQSDGWVVALVTKRMSESQYVLAEIDAARAIGDRLIVVKLEQYPTPRAWGGVAVFDGSIEEAHAPTRFVIALMQKLSIHNAVIPLTVEVRIPLNYQRCS